MSTDNPNANDDRLVDAAAAAERNETANGNNVTGTETANGNNVTDPEEAETEPDTWAAGQIMEVFNEDLDGVVPPTEGHRHVRKWCLDERKKWGERIKKCEKDWHFGAMNYILFTRAAGLDPNNPAHCPPHYRALVAHHGNPRDGEGCFRRPDKIPEKFWKDRHGIATVTPEETTSIIRQTCTEIRQAIGERDHQLLRDIAKARLNHVAKRVLETADNEPDDPIVTDEKAEEAMKVYSRYVKQKMLLPDETIAQIYGDEI
jgi:hypothetical protein